MKNEDLLIIGVQLAHPQPQFHMEKNPYTFGEEPNTIAKSKQFSVKYIKHQKYLIDKFSFQYYNI